MEHASQISRGHGAVNSRGRRCTDTALQKDGAAAPGHPALTPRDVEREHILATLRECHGNQAKAADLLGIGRNTLWRKLKEYDVKPSDEAASE